MRKLIFVFTMLMLNYNTVICLPSREAVIPAPFSKGVNFNGWFETTPKNAREIHNKYTEQDFADVKQMGFDVIRLPIDLNLFTSGAPDYIIDPFFLSLLDTAVDWAEKYQLYIILNVHPEGQPVINRTIRDFLFPVWSQIAGYFKNRSEYFIYEIFNEPHGISARDWGRIQGDVIEAIRRIDQKHWIVVGGVDFNSINALSSLPKYNDQKLLYTFHFYDPFIFTHQGVESANSLLGSLSGVPFPYDRTRMPVFPRELRGTWAENFMRRYFFDGTRAALGRKLDQAARFARRRNVPVFCGEFGVYIKNSLSTDRIIWHQYVRELFEERGIPWILYSYYNSFGMFNSQLDGMFRWAFAGDLNVNLNTELIQALDLTPFPQRQREQLKSGFSVFEDDFHNGISLFYRRQNIINLYYTPAAEGKYAIHLGDLRRFGNRWDGLSLLMPVMDFTYLARNGYVLEFKAKTEKSFPVNVVFYNFEDNINWQIEYSIDQRRIPPDGRWHSIRIPLEEMRIWGGIDNSIGQYVDSRNRPPSWEKINMLEFIAVQEDDSVHELYIDSIRITR